MLKKEAIVQGEKFKQLAIDVFPLVSQIEDVLRKHDVHDMASLTVDVTTGYFTFSTHANQWEMTKVNNEYPVNLKYKYCEVLAL